MKSTPSWNGLFDCLRLMSAFFRPIVDMLLLLLLIQLNLGLRGASVACWSLIVVEVVTERSRRFFVGLFF